MVYHSKKGIRGRADQAMADETLPCNRQLPYGHINPRAGIVHFGHRPPCIVTVAIALDLHRSPVIDF
jgi:hypothetical protein